MNRNESLELRNSEPVGGVVLTRRSEGESLRIQSLYRAVCESDIAAFIVNGFRPTERYFVARRRKQSRSHWLALKGEITVASEQHLRKSVFSVGSYEIAHIGITQCRGKIVDGRLFNILRTDENFW